MIIGISKAAPLTLVVCAVGWLAASGASAAPTPITHEFGIYKDVNSNGELDAADIQAGNLACITSMVEWLSAATSYGYKQYVTPAGDGRINDISGWPSSTDGATDFNSGSHSAWLDPQKDELQFYMAWSRLDHDSEANPDYEQAAKGFNLGLIMNRTDRIDKDGYSLETGQQTGITNPFGFTIYKPTDGIEYNSASLNLAVQGSSLDPRVLLSDDVATTSATPIKSEVQPRPPADSSVLPGQELVRDATAAAGWQQSFTGEWTYNTDTTDGGVLGNLYDADESTDYSFVIRVALSALGDPDGDGIKKIVFYTFAHDDVGDPGNLNPYDQVWTKVELSLSEGDTFFIADQCCDVPEPATLALLGVGGLSAFGFGVIRRRRAVA